MATHSCTLAWKILWTEEPGGLQSMGSLRVGHSWAASLSLFPFMHWRRTWQPTPVFLPGESQGQGSLVGCRLWGCTESGMTERLSSRSIHLYDGFDFRVRIQFLFLLNFIMTNFVISVNFVFVKRGGIFTFWEIGKQINSKWIRKQIL